MPRAFGLTVFAALGVCACGGAVQEDPSTTERCADATPPDPSRDAVVADVASTFPDVRADADADAATVSPSSADAADAAVCGTRIEAAPTCGVGRCVTAARTHVPHGSNGLAAPLRDGRVLVVGGAYPHTAEIYDPKCNVWSLAAPTHSGRRSAKSDGVIVPLADGRVYVAGVDDASPTHEDSYEIYDPIADSWSAPADAHPFRQLPAAVPIDDKHLLLAGTDIVLPYVAIFDVETETTAIVTPPVGHPVVQTAARLADGRVVVLFLDGPPYVRRTAIFDPKSAGWTFVSDWPDGGWSRQPPMTLPDGRLFFLGAQVIFDGTSGTWSGISSSPPSATAAAALGCGKFIFIGEYGGGGAPPVAKRTLWDPTTGASIDVDLPSLRLNALPVTLPDGQAMFINGDYSPTTVSIPSALPTHVGTTLTTEICR